MKVSELLEELNKVDPDFEVKVYADYDCGCGGGIAGGPIQSIEVDVEDSVVSLSNEDA